jgi:hypothetical protein
MPSSEMLRRVALVKADVSEELSKAFCRFVTMVQYVTVTILGIIHPDAFYSKARSFGNGILYLSSGQRNPHGSKRNI